MVNGAAMSTHYRSATAYPDGFTVLDEAHTFTADELSKWLAGRAKPSAAGRAEAPDSADVVWLLTFGERGEGDVIVGVYETADAATPDLAEQVEALHRRWPVTLTHRADGSWTATGGCDTIDLTPHTVRRCAAVVRQFTDTEVKALAGDPVAVSWFEANGIDTGRVALAPFRIERQGEAEVIRYRTFVLTADGHHQLDPSRPNEPWTEERAARLTVPLPAELAEVPR